MIFAVFIFIAIGMFAEIDLRAQTPLRTFASKTHYTERDTLGSAVLKVGYRYNEEGVLDSLDIYSDYGEPLHLGGLSYSKRFISSLITWDQLPPNPGAPENLNERESRVLVPRGPGVIELHRAIEDDPTGIRVTRYEYDPITGRLLSDGRYKYSYEDSSGLLHRMQLKEVNKPYRKVQEWIFYRDADNTIIGMEQWKRRLGRSDSLVPSRLLQVLQWRSRIPWESVDPDRGHSRDDFPYLPEGEPAVWFEYGKRASGEGAWGGQRYTERQFDSLGRFINSFSNRSKKSAEYANDGGLRSITYDGWAGRYENTGVYVKHLYGPDSVIWMDEMIDGKRRYMADNYSMSRFTYETGYRYADLKGDRFSPLLHYSKYRDTLWLAIDTTLELKDLSASIIDQRGKIVQSLGLLRELRTPLHALKPSVYAVRWKYRNRLVMDQVFDVR